MCGPERYNGQNLKPRAARFTSRNNSGRLLNRSMYTDVYRRLLIDRSTPKRLVCLNHGPGPINLPNTRLSKLDDIDR